jgi:hypothetical protein
LVGFWQLVLHKPHQRAIRVERNVIVAPQLSDTAAAIAQQATVAAATFTATSTSLSTVNAAAAATAIL